MFKFILLLILVDIGIYGMHLRSMNNNDLKQRLRRQLLSFSSDAHRSDRSASPFSGAFNWLNMVKVQSVRIIEGTTDFILAPIRRFTKLINYW